jgi:hypothetical protein
VRIGGLSNEIAIAEGVESALGYWLLNWKASTNVGCLSTSGMIGFEAPLGVDHVVIAPDGDMPIKQAGKIYASSSCRQEGCRGAAKQDD